MIFDSEDAFPNSVVVFIEFPSFPLREMFAYLREKEELLQRLVKNEAKGTLRHAIAVIRLEEVENQLIFMVTNCSRPEQRRRGTKALIEAAKAKRAGSQVAKALGAQMDFLTQLGLK